MSETKKKIKSICVDTLTGIQTEEYMRNKKKPGFDKFFDMGQDIYTFMADLSRLGFELVLVLGEPGTGKSTGMRTLEPGTNIWYNADNKNPVWVGGKEEYGKKNAPKAPYHVIPTCYADIIGHIQGGIEAGMFEDDRYAFITGHIENYKSGYDVMQRLKVLGNLATKMQLEGKLETVLYSTIERDSGTNKYLLETQNNGFNTARSPQGLFEPKIENDYNFILTELKRF